MSSIGRLVATLAFPLSLWPSIAEAQIRRPTPTPGAPAADAARSGPADSRTARPDFTYAPVVERNGLVGTLTIGPNLNFAIGRLAVPNFAAPRMEAAEIRRGYRNIAAVGLSLRF
jgi:hypothetical protein